jgi:uncharacterized protein YwgA
MKRGDWALLAIASAGGRSLTPVQLQKVLFILGEEFADRVGAGYYQFRPYNYGPFSSDVYSDAAALDELGLVERAIAGRSWRTFSATPEGLERAAKLREAAPSDAVRYLDAVVKWARSLGFQQLVSAIYEKYPEQRANSIFVEPAQP